MHRLHRWLIPFCRVLTLSWPLGRHTGGLTRLSLVARPGRAKYPPVQLVNSSETHRIFVSPSHQVNRFLRIPSNHPILGRGPGWQRQGHSPEQSPNGNTGPQRRPQNQRPPISLFASACVCPYSLGTWPVRCDAVTSPADQAISFVHHLSPRGWMQRSTAPPT